MCGDSDDATGKTGSDSFALIDRYRRGDATALAKLMQRYATRVEGLVRCRLGRKLALRYELADVVQGVFVRTLKSARQFKRRSDAGFVDYVARMVHFEIANLARNDRAAKRGGRLPPPTLIATKESSAVEPAASGTSIPSTVARAELALVVQECIAELSPGHREVVQMRDYAGYDWVHIATRLRRSTEAAQELHRRARHALGDLLAARPGFDELRS
jgi:RNA polymerase sigma factor (sigma-70 family)